MHPCGIICLSAEVRMRLDAHVCRYRMHSFVHFAHLHCVVCNDVILLNIAECVMGLGFLFQFPPHLTVVSPRPSTV
jgi:hypothetical protein